MEILPLLQSLQFAMPQAERASLECKLEQHISYLINHDFSRLLQLLYTVDVDEQSLKTILLQQPDRDAAETIAALILARQKEKIETRQQFRNSHMPDDERW